MNEASEVADAYVKENSLTALYDSVLIPVITAAETDYQRAALDTEQRDSVSEMADIIEAGRHCHLNPSSCRQMVAEHSPPPVPAPAWRAYCLPARAERDELAGPCSRNCFSSRLEKQNAPAKLVAGEMVKLVDEADVDAACISVVAPSTIIHARYFCMKTTHNFRT